MKIATLSINRKARPETISSQTYSRKNYETKNTLVGWIEVEVRTEETQFLFHLCHLTS